MPLSFYRPQAGPSVAQKNRNRPAAFPNSSAAGRDRTLNRDSVSKASTVQEGAARRAHGRAIEHEEAEKKSASPPTITRVIENTSWALSFGIEPDVQMHRRLAESYEPWRAARPSSTTRGDDARRQGSLAWQRHVIDLQLLTMITMVRPHAG